MLINEQLTSSEMQNQPKLEIPESLEKDTLTFVHEGGHCVAALALNRKIYAYNVAGKVSWVSESMKREKGHIAKAKLTTNEGVVSYDSHGLTEEERQITAAAGTAGELVYFGHIESQFKEQEHDRKKGGFKSILEIQEVADTLADRFESGDLAHLYQEVMNRLSMGEGFDDFNKAIDSGIPPVEYIQKSSQRRS